MRCQFQILLSVRSSCLGRSSNREPVRSQQATEPIPCRHQDFLPDPRSRAAGSAPSASPRQEPLALPPLSAVGGAPPRTASRPNLRTRRAPFRFPPLPPRAGYEGGRKSTVPMALWRAPAPQRLSGAGPLTCHPTSAAGPTPPTDLRVTPISVTAAPSQSLRSSRAPATKRSPEPQFRWRSGDSAPQRLSGQLLAAANRRLGSRPSASDRFEESPQSPTHRAPSRFPPRHLRAPATKRDPEVSRFRWRSTDSAPQR